MFGNDYSGDLARIERKLDVIMKHLGLEVSEPDWMQEVRRLVEEGQTIMAIKRVREASGRSLKAAKELVDRIASSEV